MSPLVKLLLLWLVHLTNASNSTNGTSTEPAAPVDATVVIIIVVVAVLLALGGAAYYFVFRRGAMYSALWTKMMGGSSPGATPVATGESLGNHLPMVALRVSGAEEE